MNINPGDFVKIRQSGERFWVVVKSMNGDVLTGTVDNHLIEAPMKYGETIRFLLSDVLDYQSV